MPREDLLHAQFVLGIADLRCHRDAGMPVAKLLLDRVERILRSSNSTRRAGMKRTIWRHSSEPIEPPAPVTSTFLPFRKPLNCASSSCTGSRPSRSSSSTWRSCETLTLPETMSEYAGTVITRKPAAWQISSARLRAECVAPGMAMIACVTPMLSANAATRSSDPSTFTSWIAPPSLRASSSSSATTRHWLLLARSRSSAEADAPRPAR
jgi:hypothetical protein